MTNSLKNIIEYFRDCYRSDNREMMIFDFLDKKVEEQLFITGKEELINNEYPHIPINETKALTILKKLELFREEKELLYGCFFVCGHYKNTKGKTKRLFAPLFYYTAEIILEKEIYYLKINEKERRINFPLISLFINQNMDNLINDPVFKSIPEDYLPFEALSKLVKTLNNYLPELLTENIYTFPHNVTEDFVKKTIKKLSKAGKKNSEILPLSILGLVNKSADTRGILNELADMAEITEYSDALKALFNTEEIKSKENYAPENLPMILSNSQEELLRSAAVNPLTVISGPPGTGKTYTIGAIAIEHMLRGESVLIASRTHEAVDVILHKITEQTGTDKFMVRGGRSRNYSTPLKRFLKTLLKQKDHVAYLCRQLNVEINPKYSLQKQTEDLRKKISKNLKGNLQKTIKTFEKELENEMRWGAHLMKEERSLWDQIKTQYYKIKNNIQTPIWEASESLHKMDREQISDVLKLIRLQIISHISETLEENWNDIKKFMEALNISGDTERNKKLESIDFSSIYKAFPVWLTKMSEIKDVLPFKKEMFDLLIIDEATQCDISGCLPLLQRAKRVVFAGDQNQLRHISFLSEAMQATLRKKHSLNHNDSLFNYRKNSILDLSMYSLQSADQVSMLSEHYRSLPPIIEFSNKHIYGDELKIMTARPDDEEQGLYFVYCKGRRNEDGSNNAEAEQLINDVRKLIDSEKNHNKACSSSLGILSPFRGQVDLMTKMLLDSFSVAEIDKHHIKVGTAYSFQGEERDIMYLSFALCKNSHHSAFIHINKADVFNVSITRARTQQYIYTSLKEKDVSADSLLRFYLSQEFVQQNNYEKNIDKDAFLTEVCQRLKEWEITDYWLAFNIAGLNIDLIIKIKNKYTGVDLIGYPGDFEGSFGIKKYRILNRAGLKVMPLPYSDWYFDQENALKVLKEFIYN